MVVSYLFITSSLTGHPPPHEDIDLKPNPVYGVAGSGMYYCLAGIGLRWRSWILCHISLTDQPSPHEDIDLQPNPVYGISGLQDSQDYYAWDHIHKTSGDMDYTYDDVN